MLTCEIGEARSISEGMVGFANGVQCAQLPWVERDQMWDSRTMPIIKISVLFRLFEMSESYYEEGESPIREGVPVCCEEAAPFPPLALPQAGDGLQVDPGPRQH